MRNILTIARRELTSLFTQPIAYIVAFVLISLSGLIFTQGLTGYIQLSQTGQPVTPPTVAGVLGFFTFSALFVAPALTMRTIAEERRTGTLELLLTLPVRDEEVILGKFLGLWSYFLLILALTLIYPLVLLRFGNPDIGPMLTIYLGVILAVGAMLAIGIFTSTLTSNQLVAYILGFGLIFFFYLIALLNQTLVTNATVGEILRQLSYPDHLIPFAEGVLRVVDLLYFVGLMAVFLFTAVRVLESQRWNG
jgi:ABC-2 type transport system permease protein